MSEMEITPDWLQDRANNLNTNFQISATAYGHRIHTTTGETS